MKPSLDLLASEILGICCACLLIAHRLAGAPNGYRRVVQQGATFFLGFNLMHAGYWMLQPAVRRCTRSGLSPAAISWLSLVPAMAGSVAAATGHWGAAAWCLLVSALLDVLDGAVARAMHHTSPAGAVLDSVLDRYAEFIFFAGVFVYYREHLIAQLVVLAALLGSFLVTYSTAKAEALGITPPRGWMKRSDRLTVLIVGTAFEPFSFHWFETWSGELAWPVLVAMGLMAVLANVSAVLRFTALARQAGS
jgi:CDP-diacylglycerol--glycerol-3-phosphate 3-phosphatidyltransferase